VQLQTGKPVRCDLVLFQRVLVFAFVQIVSYFASLDQTQGKTVQLKRSKLPGNKAGFAIRFPLEQLLLNMEEIKGIPIC